MLLIARRSTPVIVLSRKKFCKPSGKLDYSRYCQVSNLMLSLKKNSGIELSEVTRKVIKAVDYNYMDYDYDYGKIVIILLLAINTNSR